MRSAFLIPSK